MFESRRQSSGGSSANRWLLVAGAGLVILAFVARMLLDIGHTRVSDLAGVLRPDSAPAAAAPVPVEPDPAVPTAAPAGDTMARVTPETAAKAVAPVPTPPPPPVVASPKEAASGEAAPAPGGTAPKGVHVTVAKPPPVLRLDTTTPGNRYVVQIGAFGSETNASTLSQRASALGYPAMVIPQVRGGSTLYLVRVIRAGSDADAHAAADSLAHALGVHAVVVRPGQ